MGVMLTERSLSTLKRGAALALIWLVIAGPEPGSWIIGLPAVLFATWVSLLLAPPLRHRIRLLPTLAFVRYFLVESLRGGVDVARRTLSPRLRIAPGQIEYQSSLPEGAFMLLFGACVSLLPGTLTARVEGRSLTLHALDIGSDPLAQLEELEERIRAMLRERGEGYGD